MNWIDFLIVLIVAIIVGLIIFFNIKNHKNDTGCSKCPYSKNCKVTNCNHKNKEENLNSQVKKQSD